MHELNGTVHWREPKSGKRAGFGKFDQPLDEPVVLGQRRGKPAAPRGRPRMGGRGSNVQLHGTEGKWGCYR